MARKSILIVEDDESIREALQVLFEGQGYPVFLADHGRAALDYFELGSTPKPGLILLDLQMPVMDGPTFLLELQRHHPEIFTHTPIFIMTAQPDTHKIYFKTTGLIRKPFDLAELCGIAKRYCESSDAETTA